jgi:hypothetical protein
MPEKASDSMTDKNNELTFQERCRAAEMKIRAEHAAMREVKADLIYRGNIWEKKELTDDDRADCLEIIKDGIRERKFAQPALHAVFAHESQAKFLDDFLWNHMGDPVVIGREKPKGPGYSDGVSEYHYDYRTVINGYTDEGMLLNIRETRDLQARSKDRYAIILGNMATLQVARYRINDIESMMDGGELTQKLIITTDTFDTIDGKTPYDDAYTADGLMSLNASIIERDKRHNQQASLTLGQNILYKPFGESEQMVGGVDRVVRDRDFLSRLAIAAGVVRNDSGEISRPQSYLSLRAA